MVANCKGLRHGWPSSLLMFVFCMQAGRPTDRQGVEGLSCRNTCNWRTLDKRSEIYWWPCNGSTDEESLITISITCTSAKCSNDCPNCWLNGTCEIPCSMTLFGTACYCINDTRCMFCVCSDQIYLHRDYACVNVDHASVCNYVLYMVIC